MAVGTLLYDAYLMTKVRWHSIMPALEIAVSVAVVFALYVPGIPVSEWALLALVPVVYVFSFELGVVSALLKTPPFAALGRWSYSIYLTHFLVILAFPLIAVVAELAARKMPWIMSVYQGGGSYVIFAAATVALSSVTYRFIERPAQRFINERFNNRDQIIPKPASTYRS